MGGVPPRPRQPYAAELARRQRPLRTASVGKVLLLLAAAQQLAEGDLAPDEPLKREPEDFVADSGIWHTLSSETCP